MAQSIEQVMKEIHLLFAKCKQYQGKDDMIIVPKQRVFALLEQLNYAVSELMDQHEATQSSREIALKKFQDQKEKIEKEATKVSEDIYAASMLYTDRMLLDLKAIIERAGKDIQKEYEFLASQLESQAALLVENQEEIRSQLAVLEQGQKYKEIIEKYNDRMEHQQEEEMRKEKLQQELIQQEVSKEQVATKEPEMIVISEWKQGEKQKKKQKAKQKGTNSGVEKEKKSSEKEFLDKKEEEKKEIIQILKHSITLEPSSGDGTIKKVASVVDESALEPMPKKEILDDSPKKVSYEIKVNESWYNETSGIRSEELDAEYYQWKEGKDNLSEKEKEQEDKSSLENKSKKKEKRFLFGRKK